jgi:hypothetical protein
MNWYILILLIPVTWEVIDDRKGDSNKGFDVFMRVSLGILCATSRWFPNPYTAFILSMALHFFLFDYAINLVLGRQPWFSYLGKTGVVDMLPFWRNLHPIVRFVIRLLVLLLAYWAYVNFR